MFFSFIMPAQRKKGKIDNIDRNILIKWKTFCVSFVCARFKQTLRRFFVIAVVDDNDKRRQKTKRELNNWNGNEFPAAFFHSFLFLLHFAFRSPSPWFVNRSCYANSMNSLAYWLQQCEQQWLRCVLFSSFDRHRMKKNLELNSTIIRWKRNTSSANGVHLTIPDALPSTSDWAENWTKT